MLRNFIRNAVFAATFAALATVAGAAHAQTTLGAFTFNNSQFGNTLTESDGGTFRNGNWINTTNANPGNPGALTGVNFETGVANITAAFYTIGYNTPIVNLAGNDFGLVVGFDGLNPRDITVAVSTNGLDFSATQVFTSGSVTTGVQKNYFYNGGGPFITELRVLPLNLDAFGIAANNSVAAIRVSSTNGGDIIRVAGMNAAVVAVPEPGSFALVLPALALAGALALRRRKSA